LPQTSSAKSDGKAARICVSSWSLHNLFTATHDEKAPPIPGKALSALDFPEMIADRYHVHNVEIVSPHFESAGPSYIREFKSRLERAHSRLVNVPIDIDELWDQPALSATDPKAREKAVSMYSKWIGIAHELGASSVRCDPGKINPADPSPTIESYRALVSLGRSKDIRVIVENHGGIVSAHPEELAKILKASGAGALPDFGNFPNEEARQLGLRLLFPLAPTVAHAKLNPDRFDFGRCMQIAREAGYKGLFSVESGSRGDPYEAVQQVVDELMKYL
jgi:sugar phosphate isomerase/epimerase